jgi:hypothetical protein
MKCGGINQMGNKDYKKEAPKKKKAPKKGKKKPSYGY